MGSHWHLWSPASRARAGYRPKAGAGSAGKNDGNEYAHGRAATIIRQGRKPARARNRRPCGVEKDLRLPHQAPLQRHQLECSLLARSVDFEVPIRGGQASSSTEGPSRAGTK